MNDPNHSSFMTNNRVRKIVNAKDPLNNDLDSENNVLSEEVEMRIFSNQNHRESKIYSKDQSSSNISTKLNNIKMFTKTKVNPNSLNFEEEDESDHPSKVISNSVYEYDRVINGEPNLEYSNNNKSNVLQKIFSKNYDTCQESDKLRIKSELKSGKEERK